MNQSLMRCSLLLLLALGYIMLGSTPAHDTSLDKKLTKDFVFIPAGNIGDSLIPEFYISALEVTNKQYRDFINDLIDSAAADKLKFAMVDSLQWNRLSVPCGPYINTYFRHPAYDDYPVVNITKRGATLYCEWLTEKYNRTSKQKAHFALPSEIQWEYAAKGGNPKAIYPWPGNSLTYDKKGKYHGTNMCNYKVGRTQTDTTLFNNNAEFTAPSRSYMPNTYDIYNMAGNVAEMIADQDYTKGGSYLSPADKVLIAAREDADLSHGSPNIGFRPVMIFVTGN